jgi:pyruvate kinase
MIARWDLWVEVDPIDLPYLQLLILEKSKKAWKPCIWATQVLESMISVPRPTRAEITDVYTAITSWADYTMLSWESASWNYPYESVKFMADMWERYSK